MKPIQFLLSIFLICFMVVPERSFSWFGEDKKQVEDASVSVNAVLPAEIASESTSATTATSATPEETTKLDESAKLLEEIQADAPKEIPAVTVPKTEEVSAPVVAQAPPVVVNTAPRESSVRKLLKGGPVLPLRVREEQAYDYNGDRFIDLVELKAYLKNVVKEVNDQGRFIVKSDISYEFDKNRDGFITKDEVGEIESNAR